MKKHLPIVLAFIATGLLAVAQDVDKHISANEVDRVLRTLSADDMQGRQTFTPGIEKAADFIAAEFKKIGLKEMDGAKGYKQTFTMYKAKMSDVAIAINGETVDAKNLITFSIQKQLKLDQASGYTKGVVKKGDNFQTEVRKYISGKQHTIVFVDTSFGSRFKRLEGVKQYMFEGEKNLLFVLTPSEVNDFSVNANMNLQPFTTQNIVGVLPGKTKKEEQVIFSGHYDHLGIGKAVNGDSIYNGANDDASGVTGVIMAANYFKKAKNNDRSLVFVAFTAEEMGGFGSKYFSEKINADKVAAMFNIEMIGTDSKWQKNSAYITGYDETDMGVILQKNLAGTEFAFHPDPYPAQQLFYRSDNATLARLGVPAHTISTSKMDAEANYHKLTDDISTLDVENMTAIIKAIVKSAASIVNGTDTPTRVKVQGLKR